MLYGLYIYHDRSYVHALTVTCGFDVELELNSHVSKIKVSIRIKQFEEVVLSALWYII